MRYAEKYGVSQCEPEIQQKPLVHLLLESALGWKRRNPLACQSRRPHRHPNQHTEAEMKLIRDMRRRNPTSGNGGALAPAAASAGYTRCPESLFRVMRRQGMFPQPRARNRPYRAKPYEQMTVSGPACAGGCEGGAAQMPGKPGGAVVPVYGDRRISRAFAILGCLPGAEHLFFR